MLYLQNEFYLLLYLVTRPFLFQNLLNGDAKRGNGGLIPSQFGEIKNIPATRQRDEEENEKKEWF
jgi:hypothetical protein